jgi:ATP-binding cassette subfamily G (WHITE) protein 2
MFVTVPLLLHLTNPLPPSLSICRQIIATLGLEKCADTVIGNVLQRGISGGQAKRVNIGLALISSPGVIFLDEPTSGLDSFMANEVATTLQALGRAGRTIVCTIHSPTAVAFSKFDDLFILKGGKTVFGGTVADGLPYFTGAAVGLPPPDVSAPSFCLPEWLVDAISVEREASSTDLVEAYGASALAAVAVKECEASLASTHDLALLSGGGDGACCGGLSHRPGAAKQLATLVRYRTATHYKSGEFLGPRIGDKVRLRPCSNGPIALMNAPDAIDESPIISTHDGHSHPIFAPRD